jgi:anthranilate phosphoribosyltransferase
MKHAAQTRRDLGIRSAFNLLGPLTNPAGAARQIVGVPKPELTELVAKALLLLGSERAWVVHGADGLDELSTTGHTKISECHNGAVHTFYIHPSDFGVPKASAAQLAGGDAAENAGIVRGVLDGRKGPARDVVVFNAGAALLVAGTVASVRDGLRAAEAAIDSGAAKGTLERMARCSQEGAGA